MPATVTVGADGRRSSVARAAGLVRRSRAPRRWAYGTYVDRVDGLGDLGEMHIRPGWYMGIAPVAGGVVNVCVVTGRARGAAAPMDVIRTAIRSERELADRFAATAFDGPVRVLGPLAWDVRRPGMRGLLLVGDAGGFVDPMTGDGLSLAMRSALVGAAEVQRTLETGDLDGAVDRLTEARADAFGSKLRFNRVVRRLVDSPAALGAAAYGARLFPGLVARAVRYAGDVR
jgi:flavin-dependent dehydrogenase